MSEDTLSNCAVCVNVSLKQAIEEADFSQIAKHCLHERIGNHLVDAEGSDAYAMIVADIHQRIEFAVSLRQKSQDTLHEIDCIMQAFDDAGARN